MLMAEKYDYPLYFDIHGKPMKLMKWAKAFEDRKRWHLQRSLWRGLIQVSTVWLGLNHNYGSGKPLIFESMVFCRICGFERMLKDRSNRMSAFPYDEVEMDRYSTLRTAYRNHAKLVVKWSSFWTFAHHVVMHHIFRRPVY